MLINDICFVFCFAMQTIAKDTNVMIVAIAGKCMAGIANGIRKKFSPYAAAVSNA